MPGRQTADFGSFSREQEKREMSSISRRVLQLLAILLVGVCSLAAQSKRAVDLAAGKVLVAPRGSRDPLFARSVVLLVRFDRTGALGLMLNRRTKVPISHALPKVKGATSDSHPVFVGGPVDPGTVFALARAPSKPKGTTEVFGDIYLIQTRTALEKALGEDSTASGLRIYVGYCGWGPQQLQNEVREGRWYIFSRSEDLAFDGKPASLWQRLIDKADLMKLQKFARLADPLDYLIAQNMQPSH
jgi:putative transcriptional regulator